ncbi:cohesin domain-containing protein [Paracidobacterium acidisoli]|uniref:Type II and III secretion system protein n=1 Tax=Paracidobacterium acidisoli TaxID=2303751 RepID=A0A372IUC6_9BACT|nr:cohesin domain-containing protein [Paracidobacterium acidisoli]MBT9329436.1 type II and III secretion system protein [Paracidobacterium acidisoli]
MKRFVTWVPLAAMLIALAVISPQAHAQSAGHWYKSGQSAEAKNDIEGAWEDYNAAYQKNPKNESYRVAMERTRDLAAAAHVTNGVKLRNQGQTTQALTEFLRALEIDPSNERATQSIEEVRRQMNQEETSRDAEHPRSTDDIFANLAGPITLRPISNEPLTLHMVEDSKVIYQTVGKAAGINVLFDPDYTSRRIQVDLANVTLYDALRIIATVSNTFWKPITSNTVFVAQNSRAKRTELDQEAVQTFYLKNVAQQNDFTDVQTALRNVFQTAKLYGVASQNAIVMRGTPDELILAQKLIDDLDRPKPEVVVDVAVLEVSKDKTRAIGIQWPQTATINFQASTSTSSAANNSSGTTPTTTSGLTLNNLAHANSNDFAVTIGQAQVEALMSDTNTKILQDPQVRASDGQESTLKIGEKLPVATGSYQTGAATAIVSSLVNTQFQYLDIGVNVTMKPTVHYDGDVTLKVKVELSSQNGNNNLGGVEEPVITQRTVDQTVRLKEGEASILGGIFQHQITNTVSGWPGLGELPILKYLFSTQSHEVTDDEIVFVLIPHLVRGRSLSPENLREIDTGSGNSIELRRVNPSAPWEAAAPAALPATGQAVPAVSQASGSASAAAVTAAADMRQQGLSAASSVLLQVNPIRSVQKVGSTFQLAVNLAGGTDVYSVPMQLQYDTSKLSLTNIDLGDAPARSINFLGKDGQPVSLVHHDEGNGLITITEARPPGAKGVSGSGQLCILTFQAKASGDASVAITRPVVRNSQQQPVPAMGSQAVVHIQ